MATKLNSIQYHRNGVWGEGFYVAVVKEGKSRKVVITFPADGKCRTAVLDIDLLADGNITFGENSWRGDHYHDEMMQRIEEMNKAA